MAKFSRNQRAELPNKVCAHFDKYCEITNPVPFDPVKDIYIPTLGPKTWDALNVLLESNYKNDLLNRGYNFDLYLDGGDKSGRKWQRPHITFGFPEGQTRLPNLEIDWCEVTPATQDKVQAWAQKALQLRKLRRELFARVENLLDWGWQHNKSWDGYRGHWRGGPTSGQGCNTAGQVVRIWPELLPYLPVMARDSVRGAQVKSRLPRFINGHGTPKQFMLKDRPYKYSSYNPDDDPQLDQREPLTDEEWEYEKRKLDAMTHILVQMSLMVDVPRVKGYPTVHLT